MARRKLRSPSQWRVRHAMHKAEKCGRSLAACSLPAKVRSYKYHPLPASTVAPLRAIKSFVPGITRDNSGIPGMPTRVGATTSGRPLWVAQPEPSSAAVGGCP